MYSELSLLCAEVLRYPCVAIPSQGNQDMLLNNSNIMQQMSTNLPANNFHLRYNVVSICSQSGPKHAFDFTHLGELTL